MTAFIPPDVHEEIDFLEEVERELGVLTTAELEGVTSSAFISPAPAPALPTTPKTVIPAEAGTYTPQAVNDENVVATTPMGHRPRPAPG